MKITTTYTCDICEDEFTQYEECKKHEEQHIVPDIFSEEFSYTNSLLGEYPMNIYMPMSNGALVHYTQPVVIREPKKESPAAEDASTD